MATATAITPVETTAMPSQANQRNGVMKTATATATTLKARTATSARLNTVNRKNPQSGLPRLDLDGVTDPLDAFPDDPFQWADADGDGYGDNTNVPSGDDCVDVFGKSFEEGRQGCPDADLDGYADVDDVFPDDPEQWSDFDGDGWGDNYYWENTTVADEENPGLFLTLREQRGDALPEITSQWSDIDGDGWGDNLSSSNRVDNFPRASQWNDFDGDGFGDNAVAGSYQPDACPKVPEHRQRTMNSAVPTPITTASPTMRTRVRGTLMFLKVLEARRIAPYLRPQPPVQR